MKTPVQGRPGGQRDGDHAASVTAPPAAGEWQPIATAPRVTGKEILGSKWHDGVMIREPFISFWSPSLSKFFAGPTHWMPLPTPPTRKDTA